MGEKRWGRDRNRGNYSGGGASRNRDSGDYREGGRREGGYRDRPREGGYREGGRPREGGYKGERRPFEGGERGGYREREDRGERRSFSGGPREGGERRSFDRPREGGYRGERRGYGDRPSGGGYREGGRPREGGEKRSFNRGERGGGRSFGGERTGGSIGFRNQEGPGGRFDRAKFMQRAREETTEVLRSRDMYLALLSNCIEEEERVANQLGERLEEIYGLYFPELKVENKRNYSLIVNLITKEDVPIDAVARYVGEGKARQIADAGKTSVGGNFNERDVENMKKMAQEIEAIYALMNRHEKHMDDVAREECPNLHYLVGAKVAGKLISVAGGMKKLAVLPASTIQVMGAEKALFKHLRNRNIAPPKHGVIFQHPSISTAPKSVRGKVARALATKIAIAAKADVYTKRFIGPLIKEKFDKRLREINANAARGRGRHEDEDTPSG